MNASSSPAFQVGRKRRDDLWKYFYFIFFSISNEDGDLRAVWVNAIHCLNSVFEQTKHFCQSVLGCYKWLFDVNLCVFLNPLPVLKTTSSWGNCFCFVITVYFSIICISEEFCLSWTKQFQCLYFSRLYAYKEGSVPCLQGLIHFYCTSSHSAIYAENKYDELWGNIYFIALYLALKAFIFILLNNYFLNLNKYSRRGT